MKKYFLSVILIMLLCVGVNFRKDNYSQNIKYVVEQIREFKGLREIPEIGGSAVGSEGFPHPIFLLQEYIKDCGTLEDFKKMMRDKSPTVRVVGAQAMISNRKFLFLEREVYYSSNQEKIDWDESWKTEQEIRKEYILSLRDDDAQIVVGPGGCFFMTMTVGDVILNLHKNPNYFDSSYVEQGGEADPIIHGNFENEPHK